MTRRLSMLALAQILARAEYFFFLWMTPALLLGYLVLRPDGRDRNPAPP